ATCACPAASGGGPALNWLFNMLNHNPQGQRSLEDVIGIIGHQLRELGHTAVWDKKNDQFLARDTGINIIVEGFTPPVIEIMAGAHARGCRFVILATEEPTEKGFNHGVDPEMIMRQRMFPEAARYCEGIIHLVPGKRVTDWYGQFAPAAYTELGFARTLVRVTAGTGLRLRVLWIGEPPPYGHPKQAGEALRTEGRCPLHRRLPRSGDARQTDQGGAGGGAAAQGRGHGPRLLLALQH